MKRVLMLAIVLGFVWSNYAYAGEYGHQKKKVVKKYYNTTNVTNVTNIDESAKNIFGAKLDAPNLVEISDNWHFGLEGSKDLYNTDVNEGWAAFGKFTYQGTWFTFKKGE